MKKMGQQMTEAEINDMVEEVDINQDGKVGPEEFMAMSVKDTSKHGKQRMNGAGMLNKPIVGLATRMPHPYGACVRRGQRNGLEHHLPELNAPDRMTKGDSHGKKKKKEKKVDYGIRNKSRRASYGVGMSS